MSLADRLRNVWAAARGAAVVVEAGVKVAQAVAPATASKPASVFQTIEAASTFINTDPRAQTLIALATKLAGGEGKGFLDAVKEHDWKTVAIDVLTEGLGAAATFGVPGASLALKLLPAVVWAAEHPASVESLAMRKAAGTYDNPYQHPGNVLDVGVTVS